MKWQNLAILVSGACLLFGFGYYCVPDDQKADTFVKSVACVTEVFSGSIWFILAIIFGLTSIVLLFLYLEAKSNLKRLQNRYDVLVDNLME